MRFFRKKETSTSGTWREGIINKVQKVADTPNQKIDASIVSRVASLTIDETIKTIGEMLRAVK